MASSPPDIYFEKLLELPSDYRLGDEPRPLQIAFAQLGDEAASAIYLAGSDLDEVLVERSLIVLFDDSRIEISAAFLADAELLQRSILDQIPDATESADLRVVAIRVIARHDRLDAK